MSEDFKPRNYQEELMQIALKQNTIVFLPTGSGKTFIALLVLKQMMRSLQKSYSNGGKISVILVNTVALVEQHARYIEDHTNLTIGQYSGDMNVDFWSKEKWLGEFNKGQVIIFTSQILLNLLNNNFIDMNKINLLIFDECHRGVNEHSMRQIMRNFGTLYDPPRVLGLTATLLNGHCKPDKVMMGVKALEVTYHSKVATVDGLSVVVGYSTNPREKFKIYNKYHPSYDESVIMAILEKACTLVGQVKAESAPLNLKGLKPLDPKNVYVELINLIRDLIIQIQILGIYGGYKATLAYMIQVERLKRHCQDINLSILLHFVLTKLAFAKELFKKAMKHFDELHCVHNFSSDKMLQLFEILKEYKTLSKEELCCIIFVERRFTAKVMYHVLDSLQKCDSDYAHIRPEFIIGNNNNPFNETRESLYYHKKNKQILKNFASKTINVLVSSNVLEEGVDIPKCTLVVKFDKPGDYRSYIQSKGRARHKDSLYYIIVEKDEARKYMEKYEEFQQIEETLNDYLIGKNLDRPQPDQMDIERMYNEDELPPYFVNGPGSAQVNMLSAIPLLCQYCTSLPSDVYTTYTPEWYIKDHENNSYISVVIMLPIICPLTEPIEGPPMKNIKSAKRAAALKTCILLHKIGELDDYLLPRRCELPEEDIHFLFKHYPKEKESNAGTSKKKRLHQKQVPKYVQGQIQPNQKCPMHFLHIIHLNPLFSRHNEDINNATIHDMYTSPLCFGIITAGPLPVLCDFPIYVSMGTINVSLRVNQKQIYLEKQQIENIKKFHFLTFDGVLKILQPFLIIDDSCDAEMILLVPVNNSNIDFDVIENYTSVQNIIELTSDERMNLEVTQESFLKKIVSPWYRRDPATYIVTEVSLNKSALTSFPNEEYSNFVEYFKEKYNQRIINPYQPLLFVKGLTKKLNYIKPKGKESKRKKEKLYEEMTEYLIPELVVKQDFPASLWIQASFLPTILSRISYMLQLEELRCKISLDTGLGKVLVSQKKPLLLDEYLLHYEAYTEEELPEDMTTIVPVDANLLSIPSTSLQYNKDFASKMLESEYPWKDVEEPKDIERDLNVTIMDIEYFENFISQNVDAEQVLKRNESPSKKNLKHLALTYHKNFVEKPIQLLNTTINTEGPELCEIYRALTTAKANDIVNLERLETLGDSFLKLISSLYIILRFSNYDEGRATSLKGRLVSNKNLYYLAKQKNLSGIIKYNDLSPKDEWLPPAFTVPKELLRRINSKELSVNALFNISIPECEQISGELSNDTIDEMLSEAYQPDETDESSYPSMACFLRCQYIGDKHVADTVESLLGAYFKDCGFVGGIKFIEWMGIIPPSENLEALLQQPAANPVLNKNATREKILFHIPFLEEVENILDYHFNNPAYVLQALTHSSYTPNRITLSYEKLEFLGDAILDFLITCHIYESCGYLNPGELTDLRSALVNNNTFASLVVRCRLHKCLLMINSKLQGHIDKFVDYLKSKQYQIDDEVLILLEEDELNLAEYVDVPKVLGDVFEALAGAIYLDSGKDLKIVWKVFYKIMWKEIDLFSRNVPKNIIRRLFEWPGAYPRFGNAIPTSNQKSLVSLNFMLNGQKKVVYGCGTNKNMAKKAAAKLALRSLNFC